MEKYKDFVLDELLVYNKAIGDVKEEHNIKNFNVSYDGQSKLMIYKLEFNDGEKAGLAIYDGKEFDRIV